MTDQIQVIGAGMWRTGTTSLSIALQQLTGLPCLHMTELIKNPDLAAKWLNVAHSTNPNWPELLSSYGSTMDWPALAYWQDIASTYPNAYILLSVRDPEEWWDSVSQTVLVNAPTNATAKTPWQKLIVDLFDNHFVGRNPTKDQAINFYNQHNAFVKATVPKDRLIIWHLDDGWQPICDKLNLPMPTNDFPHQNSRQEYRSKNKL